MKQEEWKRMIQTWKSSRKHHLMKQQFKLNRMFNLSKEEINEIISDVKAFAELSDEDKEVFDWMDIENKLLSTKGDVYESLVETLIQWNFYRKKYEITEDFEFCAKIRDTIKSEIQEAKRMIDTYFLYEEVDDEILRLIDHKSREQVNINYSNWQNLT